MGLLVFQRNDDHAFRKSLDDRDLNVKRKLFIHQPFVSSFVSHLHDMSTGEYVTTRRRFDNGDSSFALHKSYTTLAVAGVRSSTNSMLSKEIHYCCTAYAEKTLYSLVKGDIFCPGGVNGLCEDTFRLTLCLISDNLGCRTGVVFASIFGSATMS